MENQKRSSKQSLLGGLFFLGLMAALLAPWILAADWYRHPEKARRAAEEMQGRPAPLGGTGAMIVDAAGNIGKGMPAKDGARAQAAARLAARFCLMRLQKALGLWTAGALAIAATWLAGWARRAEMKQDPPADQPGAKSSPLKSLLSKRAAGLTLSVALLGPLVFVFWPASTSMIVLVGMFAVAGTAAYLHASNLTPEL